MSISCYQAIKERMEKNAKGTVFAKVDFEDLGSDAAVRKALSRLVKDGVCLRVLPSVYYCPEYIEEFDDYLQPNSYDVGLAIARNYGWKVVLGPLIAQNRLGLSTQVPAQLVFTSTGPTRKYNILNGGTIYFQHCRAQFLREMSYPSALVTNALQNFKSLEVSNDDLRRVGERLTAEQKLVLLRERHYAPKWLNKHLLIIGAC